MDDNFTALIIGTDGSLQDVSWPANEDNLRHLQAAVGGRVDVVSLGDSMDMWLNDEGILEGLPINETATLLAARHGHIFQPYFGPAVITGGADDEGITLPLTSEQALKIRDSLIYA